MQSLKEENEMKNMDIKNILYEALRANHIAHLKLRSAIIAIEAQQAAEAQTTGEIALIDEGAALDHIHRILRN
jgi:hypothetical protein